MIEGLTYEAAFEIASKRYELKRGLTGIPLNAMWIVIGSDETGGYTQRVIVFGDNGLIETIDVRDLDKPCWHNWRTYSPHEMSKFNFGWAGWSVGTIGDCWKVRDDRMLKSGISFWKSETAELNKRRILEIRNATHGKIGHPHSEVKYFAIR